jgi:hypothetical protein
MLDLGISSPVSLPGALHDKLALIGELRWHDEDELGGCADVVGFEIRPWVSSANFTNSSPRNIEFGFWTKETRRY